ncbi:hypothetical protein Ccrd_024715 [Cynara cardunculus var. scolymus]|uniref:Uncharacterized protein n=1 Tax=Cynara cardunculus var. scolymus TaxID=59895 RepID=A0A118JS27_CYNCS|nr:hypothetical protein Ccrd_024715 [Cynara cardunculus var. scolymus]
MSVSLPSMVVENIATEVLSHRRGITQGQSTKHWRPTLAAITEDGVAREKVHMILMVWRMIRFLVTLFITSFETLIEIVCRC